MISPSGISSRRRDQHRIEVADARGREHRTANATNFTNVNIAGVPPTRTRTPHDMRGPRHSAETGGFEPPVRFNPDPSLAVKSIRPLWHVSVSFVMLQFHENRLIPKQRTSAYRHGARAVKAAGASFPPGCSGSTPRRGSHGAGRCAPSASSRKVFVPCDHSSSPRGSPMRKPPAAPPSSWSTAGRCRKRATKSLRCT